MRTRISLVLVAAAALATGYTLGSNQRSAVASPFAAADSRFFTETDNGQTLIVWQLEGPKVVKAQRYTMGVGQTGEVSFPGAK